MTTKSLSGYCYIDENNRLVIDFNSIKSDGSHFTLIINPGGTIVVEKPEYREGVYRGNSLLRVGNLYSFLKTRLGE